MSPDRPNASHVNIETIPGPKKVGEWLATLRAGRTTPDGSPALARSGLTGVVAAQFNAVSAIMDGIVVFEARKEPLQAELAAALFPPLAGADHFHFYTRAAVVMREWYIAELEARLAESDSPARQRLIAWRSFHRAGGKLPKELQAVFDLRFYSRLGLDESATILGRRLKTLNEQESIVRNRLALFMRRARG